MNVRENDASRFMDSPFQFVFSLSFPSYHFKTYINITEKTVEKIEMLSLSVLYFLPHINNLFLRVVDQMRLSSTNHNMPTFSTFCFIHFFLFRLVSRSPIEKLFKKFSFPTPKLSEFILLLSIEISN